MKAMFYSLGGLHILCSDPLVKVISYLNASDQIAPHLSLRIIFRWCGNLHFAGVAILIMGNQKKKTMEDQI